MFEADEQKILSKGKSNSILWVEAIAFSLLIGLSWLTEVLRLPHLLYGENFVVDWRRATLRTLVILFIWLWVNMATRRLLKRLHYLEEFVRVCGWCRNVCHEGEWLAMEKYFNSKFATKTSHGMCPDCLKKNKDEIVGKGNPDSRAVVGSPMKFH
ncbi:MAG TPA: hypothetical protein VG938_11015 [Verrucomicrobiae bacterium]|jgi:hypothetical protein|nr:hypothetical protein [Verrucomicrobiae bacterium]